MASLASLKSQVKGLRRENALNRHFIPEGIFFQTMTDDRLEEALQASKIKFHQRKEVFNEVRCRGKKIFGILLLTDLIVHLPSFIERGKLEDAMLPFTKDVLTETIGLPDEQATDFIENQWLFAVPTFQRGTINRRLPMGSVLPFEQEKRIGEGSFGRVYEVVLSSDHQPTGDDIFPQKFVRKELVKVKSHELELENLSILNHIKHSNIVELLSSYTFNRESHNLLFPLVKRGNLKDFMKLKRQDTEDFSDELILVAIADLSSAVMHLHEFSENRIEMEHIGCHHDLKPENILVSETTFILADFGLSKLKPSTEGSETAFRPRTDDYVAPECEDWDNDYRPGMVRRSSDVWSFGCILAEVATYVALGNQGVEDFHAKRKHQRPCNTHFSFHFGSGQSSEAVNNQLSKLEASSAKPFFLLIHIVREMLALDCSKRPKAREVTFFVRAIVLYQLATDISDQFSRVMDVSPTLDVFLERTRFSSWMYAVKLLNVNNGADLGLAAHGMVDNLAHFHGMRDHLLGLREHLTKRLTQSKTANTLDISFLSNINDKLDSFLTLQQRESSREYFNVTAVGEDDKLDELCRKGDQNNIILSHEIRMRSKIRHMNRLLEEDSTPEARSMRIDESMIEITRRFGQHSLGQYKDDKGSRPIWLEWRRYAHHHNSDEGTMAQVHKRNSKLAELLSQDRPESSRMLRCSGFFHRPQTGFGLVFEVPHDNPTSLRTLIEDTIKNESPADLDDRFKLASILAGALLGFHSLGWLHKSLTTENIIFFKNTPDESTEEVLQSPWIVGFNHSRRDEPLAFTSGLADTQSEMYQHPVYLKERKGYRAEFDYYSLGIILIEIGCWDTLKRLFGRREGTYESRRQKILDRRVPILRHSMGRDYAEAVRFCIEGDVGGAGATMSPKEVHLRFARKVVEPLRGVFSWADQRRELRR